jgi:hydroxyacylglutathione hydrolase
LAKELNVPLMGMIIKDHLEYQDLTFQPDIHLKDGDLIKTDEYVIEAIHTPGHASNHICYLLKDINYLITGDHIMQGSTVVIAPPDGNMRDYLSSLEKLKNFNIEVLAPGHGDYIHKPFEAVDWIINHRLNREKKVLEKVRAKDGIALDDLVKDVYDDVDPRLHRIAKASLEAHLIKLQADGKVGSKANVWKKIN